MKVQGFIFNWKGHETNAATLQERIAPLCSVRVINSEERLREKHAGWIHLDDTAYFSAQWNKACELFDADVLFHIQADVEFDRFDALFSKASSLWNSHRVGVYEPNIDVTIPRFRYNRSKLRQLEADVFEIPMSDCTCWFIDGEVVRKLPPIDLSSNRYGWGISAAVAALCRLNGRRCIRDYSFTVRHPRGTGYSTRTAQQQRDAYFASLDPNLRRETLRLDVARRSATAAISGVFGSLLRRCKRMRPVAMKIAAWMLKRFEHLQHPR